MSPGNCYPRVLPPCVIDQEGIESGEPDVARRVQSLIAPSWLAEASVRPSGENATALTAMGVAVEHEN